MCDKTDSLTPENASVRDLGPRCRSFLTALTAFRQTLTTLSTFLPDLDDFCPRRSSDLAANPVPQNQPWSSPSLFQPCNPHPPTRERPMYFSMNSGTSRSSWSTKSCATPATLTPATCHGKPISAMPSATPGAREAGLCVSVCFRQKIYSERDVLCSSRWQFCARLLPNMAGTSPKLAAFAKFARLVENPCCFIAEPKPFK